MKIFVIEFYLFDCVCIGLIFLPMLTHMNSDILTLEHSKTTFFIFFDNIMKTSQDDSGPDPTSRSKSFLSSAVESSRYSCQVDEGIIERRYHLDFGSCLIGFLTSVLILFSVSFFLKFYSSMLIEVSSSLWLNFLQLKFIWSMLLSPSRLNFFQLNLLMFLVLIFFYVFILPLLLLFFVFWHLIFLLFFIFR